MNYLVFISIAILIANLNFISCLDETKFNQATTVQIRLDDQSGHNTGQEVIVNVEIKNIEKDISLLLRCRDDEKCMKVFGCSSDCGTLDLTKDETITRKFKALSSGKVVFYLTNSTNDDSIYPDLKKSFVEVAIGQSQALDVISAICGWIYFISWSISFYPQILLNIKRKSVVGLNFDFIALNVTGFFFYSIFNVAMYFIQSVKDEYTKQNPFSLIPVEPNDVVFAVHAFLVSVVTLVQCFCIYERANQTISRPSVGLLIIFWLIAIISSIVLAFDGINVLVYLNLLSYIKLFISFIKYIPQAYYNYLRKSTSGWSIGDFVGGSFSLLQICILNFNYDNWGNIKGNLTKFGLGLLSMSFDVLFIIQHYVLYRKRDDHAPVQNSNSSDAESENRRINA